MFWVSLYIKKSVFSIFDVRKAIVAQNKKDGQNYRTRATDNGQANKTCFDGCLYKATTAVEECPEGAPSERRNKSLIEISNAGYIKQPVNGN